MRRSAESGASMVEFALILPILVVLLFGIIEFGILFYDKAVITNASREGARAGIVYADPRMPSGEIEDIVLSYCQNFLITFGAAVMPTVSTNPGDTTALESGESLTVTVSYPYTFLVLPNFITTLTGPINLVAQTTMRAE
jgi:Flp pilus assembly protein TadG